MYVCMYIDIESWEKCKKDWRKILAFWRSFFGVGPTTMTIEHHDARRKANASEGEQLAFTVRRSRFPTTVWFLRLSWEHWAIFKPYCNTVRSLQRQS